jgi:subtilisin family serine protease
LADTGPTTPQDAIVIYRSELAEEPRVRGRLRDLKSRLAAVEARATAQQAAQSKLFEDYQREGARRMSKPQPLATRSLGGSVLPVAKMEVTRKTLAVLAEQPNVVAVMPNQRVALIEPKTVDYQTLNTQERKDGLTWGLKQLDIPEIWKTTKGADINVAVMDTGVHGDHPALQDRVRGFMMADPLGRRVEANPSFDGDEHGTHVCGTIAGGTTPDGVSIGVAPEANLLVAGVLVGRGTLAALIEGLSWAIENGADVINMSLGFAYYEPLFTQVFDLLLDNGALPVVAIGNESHGNTSSPGSAYNALSVGAFEKQTGGKLAVSPFSSGASLSFPGEEPSLVIKPDIVAPGAQVYSAIPPRKTQDGSFEYNYMDGTSMATPHVAGVPALLLAAEPEGPLQRIVEVMQETAKHPGGNKLRPDNRWGFGMIQPVEALKALKS